MLVNLVVGFSESIFQSRFQAKNIDCVGDKISESHVDMGNERERKTYAEVTKEKTSKQVNETKAVRFIL